MSEHTDNERIITVGEETDPDEGWFECWVCGLHAGFADFSEALSEAEDHSDFDCEQEVVDSL